ncbi:DUF4263 domain-containing protein, partial [Leptospira levettii]|uniref:Shedu anti-phage system protein SduA domain-containing protein n=1 Tax=Leptospira levettii TaxID=2023178 RepID=UPI00108272D0
KPVVLNNCSFFWTDADGGLKIKHIDLLELFPYDDGNLVYHSDDSFTYFSNYIVSNPVPIYDVELHKTLNKFIELINLKDTSEPDITKYLANNPKILQIAFGIYELNPQIDLIWQYNPNHRKNLKPDFLPKKMDGFCDIMEFKLPNLKSTPLVGSENRLEPSYEIDKAIAQVDEYDEWFEQQNNRDWLLKEKGINVHKPLRYIIMGHSKDFLPEDRQRLRSKRNTIFFTYDEFIEAARSQLYRIK